MVVRSHEATRTNDMFVTVSVVKHCPAVRVSSDTIAESVELYSSNGDKSA